MNLLAFFTGIAAAVAALLIPSGGNLEYEHVTMAATIVAVCWPLVALHRSVLHHSSRTGSLGQWMLTVAALFGGLAVPGSLMFASKICPCSETGYGQWLMVQALPSCLFGAMAGNMAIITNSYFRTKSLSTGWFQWHTSLLWLAVVAISITGLAATLWFMPQKRTVDILLGFLHGPIYDERIWLHRDVILARAGHAFLFAATGLAACTWQSSSRQGTSCLGSTRPHPGFARRTVIGALASGWLIMTIMTWESPITGHGSRLLQKQFSGHIDGTGFQLFHNMKERDASRLADEAAFHIRDLKKIFGPIEYPAIDIYAYSDARTKKLWFGGGATDVTDVVTPGVHITAGGRRDGNDATYISPHPAPHPTLRHELVHALTSRIAFHGLGFHPNMAITEGLAVAFAPDANIFSAMSLDEGAAELLASGRLKNPEHLFSPWTFWQESGPRAYTVAGSLIGWMARSPRFNGINTVTELYAGKNWEQTTGENSGNLIAAWQQEISQDSSNQKNILRKKIRASTIFRSGGIASDSCPHSFSDQLASNPDTSELERIGQITRDPAYQLMVLRKKAHATFIAHDRPAAANLGEKIANDLDHPRDGEPTWPPRNEEEIEMRILAIDLMDFGESKIERKPNLADLAAFHDSHPLPMHLARQILVRERLGQILPPDAAASWRWYLAGWSAIPILPVSSEGVPWLLNYLHLRNLVRNQNRLELPRKINRQISVFIRKIPDKALTSREPAFAFEWYRSLAQFAENGAAAGKNPVAHALWLKAAASVSSQNNLTVRDQMEQNARRTGAASVP